MPGQGRLGDKAHADEDAHGCPSCPHPSTGRAISGSPDVMVNGRPALRVDDVGIHAACCGPNMWSASQGSATVFINGKPAFRVGDPARHCGGDGSLIEGSEDVIVDGSSSTGGGGGGASSSASAGAGASGAAQGGHALAARSERAASPSAPPFAPEAMRVLDWIGERAAGRQQLSSLRG